MTGTQEIAPIRSLRPHPRNYRKHPEDQLAHLARSLQQYGFYRPVVVANDNTVLAGHGLLDAAKSIGLTEAPIIRFAFGPDDPIALKLVVADNEIGRLAEIDDRTMTELLKELLAAQEELLGTGFNEEQLAALVMTTRSRAEIESIDAAAEWVGMPTYENVAEPVKLVVSFRTKEDRDEFIRRSELVVMKKLDTTWSTWWPTKIEDDLTAVMTEG